MSIVLLEGRQGPKRPASIVETDGWLKVPGMPSHSPALESDGEEELSSAYRQSVRSLGSEY